MKILAIDIGNARIKAGIYYRGAILCAWTGPSTRAGAGRCLQAFAGRREIESVGIVSVVPSLTPLLVNGFKKLKKPVKVVRPSDSRDMRVTYRPVSQLGADRYANAVGAAARYGTPVIVVDGGTAVTVDAVVPGPRFVGGVILPGPELMGKALAQGTARLSEVPLMASPRLIGNSTVACIQSGVIHGLNGAVGYMVEHMKRELGRSTRVVVTGGGARWIRPVLKGAIYDAHLTLKAVFRLVFS